MSHPLILENIRMDHQALLHLTRLFAEEEGTCLLYSGGQYETAQQSFLFLLPFDFIWIQGERQCRFYSNGEGRTELFGDNPWDGLKSFLNNFNNGYHFPEWVGFLGYEMGSWSDQEKRLNMLSANTPDAYFQRCAVVLVVDHMTERGVLWIADQAEYFLNEKQRQWFNLLTCEEYWKGLLDSVRADWPSLSLSWSLSLESPIETEESYSKKIEQAKELIRLGEIYQVNLSQKFELKLKGSLDSYHLFYRLNQINPAPFSAYFHLRDLTVISMSPERFLKKRGRSIESRPIKGTAPRGKTPEEDVKNKSILMASVKERAELLMITDLMRNDLGKLSLAGTVATPRIWECETYANVFHLSSTIRAELVPNLHPIEVVRSCFPGGSITGCPKLRSMEIIAQLENRARGIYTGAIGYMMGNGDFDFNIAIRTLVKVGDVLSLQLGGAIVADSDPKKEYEETLHKGSSILKALQVSFKLK